MTNRFTCTDVSVRKGVTFGFYARNGYFHSEQARQEVDRMVELNIQWVCLVSTVMQESYASVRQFRDFAVTPADDELRDMIDYIHERGMKVELRPMLECWDGTQRVHIWFPDDLEIIPGKPCTHASQWFASMTERTLHYASLAQRAGCEAYGLDSEVDRIVGFNSRWKEVVAAARSVFSGSVTSCHTHHLDFIGQLQKQDHWFRDLDYLGTSFYHRSADKPASTVKERMAFLRPVLEQYREIAELLGKPLMFGEMGCTSCTGAGMSPGSWTGGGNCDQREQADHLEAILRLFWNEPWWAGLYWWKWDEQNDRPQFRDDPTGDKGFTIYGKKAADVMKQWYRRTDR